MSSGLSEIKDINGIAIADIDGDYDLDLFAVVRQKNKESGEGKESRLFRNNGDGTYADITTSSGIISSFDYSNVFVDENVGMKMGASWGDFNNDGFPDLLLTSIHHLQLFKNIDGQHFEDITAASNIPETNACWNSGATWWDYNSDGFLDLFITKWGGCSSNMLYKNNGNGQFSNVTEALGLNDNLNSDSNEPDASWMSFPYDFNSDGLLDLLITSDFGVDNRLFINSGKDGFNDQAKAFGIHDTGRNAMGITSGDPNNDGQLDFYITNIATSSFFESTTDSSFKESSEEWAIEESDWAWGTQFADMDNDSDEDLIIVNGYAGSSPDYYYENLLTEGRSVFENRSRELGFQSSTEANGLAVFDYDNDGDLDFITSNGDESMHFFDNELISEESENSNWVEIWLKGTISNRSAIGSRVKLTSDKGTYYRYHSGADFLAQNLTPVHFGLADANQIIELKVYWPSGEETTLNEVPLNAVIEVTENGGLKILENITAKKRAGCTDFQACNYDPNATRDNNSCQYLESREIIGSSTSANLKKEKYSYPIAEGLNFDWHVEGGKITSHQNTKSIEVEWGLESVGKIILRVNDSSCYSEILTKNVSLRNNSVSIEKSIARLWNEILLEAIRNDFARPTIHARNLFHASVAMYDIWAVLHPESTQTYLLGKNNHGYVDSFDGFSTTRDKDEALIESISYAMNRLLKYRFRNSPGFEKTEKLINEVMLHYGFDASYTGLNYSSGNPADFGNYVANVIINYGLEDRSRETSDYDNSFYSPINAPLKPDFSGNRDMSDPNRWQPLQLSQFIDQAGNPINTNTPEFLNPEWGKVYPFSLSEANAKEVSRNENTYVLHFDPSSPPYLDTLVQTPSSNLYQWNFSLVSAWSAHLDPNDGVMWDISPANIGNLKIADLPKKLDEHPSFYSFEKGGDSSPGHSLNPIAQAPYTSQVVPRGDYTRVLAEFWADGPDSETPPGHWFTLLNYVSDHELLVKKFEGKGSIINDLEWDIKSYFLMGGAMHDAAIAAWSIKGWYDYIRPISAIRYMADLGQSSSTELPNYHIAGIPLKDGLIELVKENDPLVGDNNIHINKIKVYAWRGHKEIFNFENDQAGVGWILAENWWPYQRPSFVTPPFAGYVSGHSTFSRAAAEVLTSLTGDPFFPGGMGEFLARKNEFLVFEQGPSQDIVLQWATYRDASDQCSLSRIWGGIHPPADDIPGRIIGEQIGRQAFQYGKKYFTGNALRFTNSSVAFRAFPNPVSSGEWLNIEGISKLNTVLLIDILGRESRLEIPDEGNPKRLKLPKTNPGIYILSINNRKLKILIE